MSWNTSGDEALPTDYVLGVYRIVGRLGQGGFGITYKARDQFDSHVAIKEYLPQQYASRRDGVVQPRSPSDAQIFEWGLGRFIDEGRVLRKFKHGNIVSVFNYLELNGTAYLVMEFEEGPSLEKWISARASHHRKRCWCTASCCRCSMVCRRFMTKGFYIATSSRRTS